MFSNFHINNFTGTFWKLIGSRGLWRYLFLKNGRYMIFDCILQYSHDFQTILDGIFDHRICLDLYRNECIILMPSSFSARDCNFDNWLFIKRLGVVDKTRFDTTYVHYFVSVLHGVMVYSTLLLSDAMIVEDLWNV